ncbi:MAG: 2-C-methyl-D-erythritol 4-phosphate cytidylyltransferase [Clostridia bacterium]|nr:2-C-methyl-D-erythritol 4-phosphate cytidylyltransferase [Clostridia bacterium]
MAIAILLAGGTGQRVGANVPKQFLEVKGKPVVQYPLEILEKHPQIDAIEVVCVEDFIDGMWEIVNNAGLKKVRWITPGGATAQDSIKNGLDNLKGKIGKDETVLIHMSSYPLSSAEQIADCIRSAEEHGNGFAARPIVHASFYTDDRKTSVEQIDRDRLMLCSIPYAVKFGECSELYDRAYAEGKGIAGNVYTNTLYCDYGKRIYFTKDSDTNIKVTTSGDILMMEAVLNLMEKE